MIEKFLILATAFLLVSSEDYLAASSAVPHGDSPKNNEVFTKLGHYSKPSFNDFFKFERSLNLTVG